MLKIYVADLAPLKNTDIFDSIYRELPAGRRFKVDHIKPATGKMESAGAGWLLKLSLDDIGRGDLIDQIAVSEGGKPYFNISDTVSDTDSESVFFNLSHTRGMAMCVLSSEPVGCDIQITEHSSENIAKRFYSDAERAYVFGSLHNDIVDDDVKLSELEEGQKAAIRDRFYRIWVMKEAYVKFTGEGLGHDFSTFSVFDLKEYFYENRISNCRCAVCSTIKVENPTFEIINIDPRGRG